MDPGILRALGALFNAAEESAAPERAAPAEGAEGPEGRMGGLGSIAILTVPGRGIVGTAITPNGPKGWEAAEAAEGGGWFKKPKKSGFCWFFLLAQVFY